MAAPAPAIRGHFFVAAAVVVCAMQCVASLRMPPLPQGQDVASSALAMPWQMQDRRELLLKVPLWKGAPGWMQMTSTEAADHGIQFLGRGAYGEVYTAGGGRAAKILLDDWLRTPSVRDFGSAVDFFDKEAIVLANVRHPHIIRMLGYFKMGTRHQRRVRPMLLLERADSTVEEVVRRERPDLARVLDLARQALEGVAALAARQLVHGDLCLDNLFVFGAAPHQEVKLADLGFVCSVADDAAPFLRCPRFMYRPEVRPPEVWRAMRLNETARLAHVLRTGSAAPASRAAHAGDPALAEDPTSDVWAMGVLLYSAVFGRSPLDPPPPDEGDRFTALCIEKYCPPYLPQGVQHTCEEVCTRWPRERIQHVVDDYRWGERLERFRASEALSEAGPSPEQAQRLGGDAWVYRRLRRLLLCMLREEPSQRCLARQAARRLASIVDGLAECRGRPCELA